MRIRHLHWIPIALFTLTLVLLVALLATCGGKKSRKTTLPTIGSTTTERPAPGVLVEQSLDEALAELDVLQAPSEVDPALFDTLKKALAEQLMARGVSKIVSKPPTGEANRVDDLELIDDGDGTYTLTWSYTNVGDYGQDGTVGIEDITPIAICYNQTAVPANEWIDGDSNGAIGISDITPLAVNFNSELAGYSVQGVVELGAEFTPIDTVAFADATGEERLQFSFDLGALSHVYHRVVPYDSSSVEGEPSRVIGEFHPTSDVNLDGGTYAFTSIDIPPGVTVTVLGDATFEVSGDINVEGTLTSDGYEINIQGQGDITITGTVDNSTDSDPEEPGDLIIQTDGGVINIGTEDTAATLDSSGNIDITNDPSVEGWEFDVLPHERSATQLPPVGAATADIIHDSLFDGSSAEIQFYGEGADPDGGPVTYEWDFGDGASSTEKYPVHTYTAWGTYDVILMVTDDDGEFSLATLRIVTDDGEENIPESPGIWIEPPVIVAEVSEEVFFSSDAVDAQGEELTYNWDFGDMGSSSEPNPSHAFTTGGRYDVALTVTDTDTNESTATASVYVFVASAPSSLSTSAVIPPNPDGTFNFTNPVRRAPDNRPGKRGRLWGSGTIVFNGGDVRAMHGGNGVGAVPGASGSGRYGRQGGSLDVSVRGTLIIRGGTFSSGDGGAGEAGNDAAAAGGSAHARGGSGGNAASRLRIAATVELDFQGPVTLNPGSGGNGGNGTATCAIGNNDCPRGQNGGAATAYGGRGGNASKLAILRGTVNGLINVTVDGGRGGQGGDATATSGGGGHALNCATNATGGDGGKADAKSGKGGNSRLSGATGGIGAFTGDAFEAGDGGTATATAGAGGNAIADIPGPTIAEGGAGGAAVAYGRPGGTGGIPGERRDGDGGSGTATGGRGGNATANPDPPVALVNQLPGLDATATGGKGGFAFAFRGSAGGSGGTDGTATANGGDGGDVTAVAGDGGHCDKPAGDGAKGGKGKATGGGGGNAAIPHPGAANEFGGKGGDVLWVKGG